MADPVDRALVGMADEALSPTGDRSRLGSVRLEPPGPFTVRERATLRVDHVVGHHGLDDRGAVKIVMRFPADGGAWQTEDPTAPNFVTVAASRPCTFRTRFEAFGHARPWFKVFTAQVLGGCLAEGDTVTFTLALRLQTFCEDAHELRVLVDPCATGQFVEVGTLVCAIGPDVPALWRAVGPTRWPVGVPFRLGIRAEDRWGNPTDRADAVLTLSGDVDGLPDTIRHAPGTFGTVVDGLVARRPGVVVLTVTDAGGNVLAEAPPIRFEADEVRSWWGDLHGQSAESIGTNTAEAYFRFARDRAFLDVCAHQANDFQVTNAFWARLDEVVAAYDAPGRFVTFPGYEWSGNTSVGGDRNVFFRHGGQPIRRSSHALLTDRSDLASDCTTADALFDALRGQDVVIYAHVGGRWADLRRAHDEDLERAVEVHSDWGTFEWLLEDALALGFRVGVVANSDGHKGRPGASHPGAATFGAYGGLTCFLAPELGRDAIFAAIRARRTYATTGARLDLDLRVAHEGGVARMGDVVPTGLDAVQVTARVVAGAPVDTLDLLVGTRVVARWRPPAGRRVAVRWEGARYRGRGREVTWDGDAELVGARIGDLRRINAWNPDHASIHDERTIRWAAITTGNFGGFDLRLDESPGARLRVRTGPATLDVALSELDGDGVRVDAGGLGMALSARRIPDDNPHRDVVIAASVPVAAAGDTAIRVRVTLEDGHQAWSSPVYVHRSGTA